MSWESLCSWRRGTCEDRSWRLRGIIKTVRIRRVVPLITLALMATACSTGQMTPATTQIGIPPSSQPLPTVVTSATPAGWVPVSYGDAQISVPASFSVRYPGWNECGAVSLPGTLELGPATASAVGCGAAPPSRKATTTQILQGHSTFQLEAKPPIVINGLGSYALINHISGKVVGYYSPALGVEIIGSGPLAGHIFRTLTRAPRSVALAAGSAPSVPSGWHAVTFQGLSFEAPQSWPVTPTAVTFNDVGEICGNVGVTFTSTEVVLSTDLRPFPEAACLILPPTKPQPPIDGIEVDAGNVTGFPIALSFSKHCLDLHGLTACPATTPAESILVLRVTVPGRTRPVTVSIGLAGNGMVARTILYSLRAA